MRTFLFLALSATLFLTSCEKESEFAVAKSQLPTVEQLRLYASAGSNFEPDDNNEITRDYCIELSTSNWLSGYGTREPAREFAIQTTVVRVTDGVYTIEANGDGFSEEFARSKSELQLTFNARINKVEGKMVTHFYHGEELEQYFEGDALVVYDHGAIILKANVIKGELRTAAEQLGLIKGEIIIALPQKPEGWFETNIYSAAMFCTGIVD